MESFCRGVVRRGVALIVPAGAPRLKTSARRLRWGVGFLAVAVSLSLCGKSAWALIIDGTNGNTSQPTAAQLSYLNGGSSFNSFYNVGTSSTGGASFVYLGDGWCISAAHVTISNVYPHLAFNGNFDTSALLTVSGSTTYSIATAGVDLQLFHIDQVPDLPSLTIAGSTPPGGTGASSQVIVVGNGIGAQTGTGGNPTQTYWNNVTVSGGTVTLGTASTTPPANVTNPLPAAVSGSPSSGTYQASGYTTAGANTIRWGTNLVTGSEALSYASYNESAFYTTFNDSTYAPPAAQTFESQFTSGDSGGGMFHYNSGAGRWELAGVNVVVESFAPNGTVLYGDSSFAVDLSQYKSQILAEIASVPIAGWIGAADGNWANANNWTGPVPGAIGTTTNTNTAVFNQNAPNSLVAIDAGRNVQYIAFDTARVNSITLGMTGGQSLLLSSGGSILVTPSVVNPQTVNAPLVLEGNYTFTSGATSNSATLSLGGGIASGAASGTTTLTLNGSNAGANTVGGDLADGTAGSNLAVAISGSGVWTFKGASSTYSGGTTIAAGATLELAGSSSALGQSMNIANAGSLLIAGSTTQTVGTATGTGNIAVSSGILSVYQIRQNSLTIAAGAAVTLLPSGSGSTTSPASPNNVNFSSSLASLSIAGTTGAWTGTLDIGNNGLVIAYGGSADPYATIENMIESGYNGGVWTGKGITSSMARAAEQLGSPTPSLNIGLLDFTPGAGNYSNATFIVFDGQTIATNAILVRLTYMDDLVLAGDMSTNDATSDALLFAANFGSGTTWAVGDLTHDGTIDTNDALLFAANFLVGLPSLDGSSGADAALGSGNAAVPEPASLIMLAVGAAGVLAALAGGRKRD